MYFTLTPSPYGDIALTANEQGLTALAFQEGALPLIIDDNYTESPSHFIEVCQQLKEYFLGKRTTFNVPLAPQGTPFQQKVWQALLKIKQGDTKSYLWIAKRINNEKAVRAVGAANGRNPIALIIPCHRVIGANGKLTGYAGGLALKAKLLMHEKAQFSV
ncbi:MULTISPECIES: methylated-DNA--[protein]-cysteine S-methyltransferase [unclassified Colwellia]|uniref:methylated-DNA--[protein]-cysteine S-methyltransferase n=1 Tax=unclassified Colwellia TaxID=196834 RepID=UPI0015F6A6D9|nr:MULTISPECIES: methylated-DNA--[protein]-cysteine S-methyltransferase [unclassified Colwellia]MBA6233357.1 methylated-DNA--[protein]-cysteine S-methyltransferase [Colwellia sp. MB02u-7]MBA6236447.1 methylated-DNA--[protein]-cysteine S-methyltransferase [Colwellia sp. MB02u-11]MBA6256981.1 methylated-DNA--[protein]-cysteine S-methyltransferase [Colwellia sp. MB3u-28]MBA6261014.1 methylated-DNA--[protein]-cysteine S-methyltransferase [Colwellia sp. MB3u-41]MBA6298154.1 methylated-DNA--[protein